MDKQLAIHQNESSYQPTEMFKKVPLRHNSPLEALSTREREILAALLTGQTNKEVAQDLGITHRTVEAHRRNIMNKFGVRNGIQLGRLTQVLVGRCDQP